MLGDHTVRALLIGGTALLFLIVIIDAFGARDRATAAREAARLAPPAADGPRASVPAVYRVPRDLASEAVTAAQQSTEIAVADDVVSQNPDPKIADAQTAEDAAEPEIADAQGAEDVAEPEMADASEPVQEPAVEDAAEPEMAETAATDDAEETAADVATEDATEAEIADAEIAEEAPVADTATEGDALALLAGADIDNGQRVWRQCAACHVYDAEQNRGGPHLVNIIGRDVGVAEGWRYSRALSEHGGVWTVDALLAWLENPDTYIPGNQMAFRGVRDEQDRIDLLGFLSASHSN